MNCSTLLTSLLLIGILPAWGQPNTLATNSQLLKPVPQIHAGRITFAARDIPLEKYQASDFLTFYTFTPKSELT
jgi:hypothetical protein